MARCRRYTIVLMVALVVVLAGCDWPQFRGGPQHTGASGDPSIDANTLTSKVGLRWYGSMDNNSATSPTLANGVVYTGGGNGSLYAFDATGKGCSGTPITCDPLWVGHTNATIITAPAVADGVVYVSTFGGALYAFDASGGAGCVVTFGLKSCPPLWIADMDSHFESSPVVANGVVYVGSNNNNLYAFDAAGVTGCTGTSPRLCKPLWSAPTGLWVESSPAVADGVVYVGSFDNKLYAFDALGTTNCSGTPKTCLPLWTAPTGASIFSSPAVADGVVYVGSDDKKLYAFDAAGVSNCSGMPTTCAPLWTATMGDYVESSPAVANGVVYVGSDDHNLYAFDAKGNTNCAGTPTTCSPLWTAVTGGSVFSSPAVAHGIVYVGSYDGHLYAFDGAGVAKCSGSPQRQCSPIWSAPMKDGVAASPAIGHGWIYAGSVGLSAFASPAQSG